MFSNSDLEEALQPKRQSAQEQQTPQRKFKTVYKSEEQPSKVTTPPTSPQDEDIDLYQYDEVQLFVESDESKKLDAPLTPETIKEEITRWLNNRLSVASAHTIYQMKDPKKWQTFKTSTLVSYYLNCDYTFKGRRYCGLREDYFPNTYENKIFDIESLLKLTLGQFRQMLQLGSINATSFGNSCEKGIMAVVAGEILDPKRNYDLHHDFWVQFAKENYRYIGGDSIPNWVKQDGKVKSISINTEMVDFKKTKPALGRLRKNTANQVFQNTDLNLEITELKLDPSVKINKDVLEKTTPHYYVNITSHNNLGRFSFLVKDKTHLSQESLWNHFKDAFKTNLYVVHNDPTCYNNAVCVCGGKPYNNVKDLEKPIKELFAAYFDKHGGWE